VKAGNANVPVAIGRVGLREPSARNAPKTRKLMSRAARTCGRHTAAASNASTDQPRRGSFGMWLTAMSIPRPATTINSKRPVDERAGGRSDAGLGERCCARAQQILAALLLVGCGASQPDNAAALSDIASGRGGREVLVQGTVERVFRPSYGPDGEHEQFLIGISSAGQRADIFVAHNVGIAPYVPLRTGDDVTVKGDLEIDAAGPVIHWTHHDPAFRHEAGFIEVHGRLYQ